VVGDQTWEPQLDEESVYAHRTSVLRILTSNDDIKNQDNQTDDTTSAAIFPGILLDGDIAGWSTESKGEEGELEEEADDVGQHVDWFV